MIIRIRIIIFMEGKWRCIPPHGDCPSSSNSKFESRGEISEVMLATFVCIQEDQSIDLEAEDVVGACVCDGDGRMPLPVTRRCAKPFTDVNPSQPPVRPT